MVKILVTAVFGTAFGFAMGFAQLETIKNSTTAAIQPPVLPKVTASCTADKDLEAALLMERHATQSLLHEIDRLEAIVASTSTRNLDSEAIAAPAWLASAWAELESENAEVGLQQQLIDGGFDSVRADWLVQRESELQAAAASEADGEPLDVLQTNLRARKALRAEIGDYEYEQYLGATGQSTRITVTEVLQNSPAEAGGLQVGDQIIDYAGTRVFNVLELGDAAGSSLVSDSVIVNIERDGAPMQLVLPRGALGIFAGKPPR